MNWIICAVMFVSGVLSALPMAVPALFPLSWVSLAPLAVYAMTRKKCFRAGLVWGIGFYGVLYYWFIYLYPLDFAGLNNASSVVVIAVAWIGMTALQSPVNAFVPFLFRRISLAGIKGGKSAPNGESAADAKPLLIKWSSPLLFASLWTIAEWVQTLGWIGVPWGRLALSQYGCPAAIQGASLLGSLSVSFLIAAVNGYVALAWLDMRGNGKFKVSKYAVTALAVAAANFLYGFVSLAAFSPDSENGSPVRVALIQGNIGSWEKWKDDSLSEAVNKYITLTKQAAEEYSPQIIVWPETVVPTYINYSDYAYDIEETARETGAVILAGTFVAKTDKSDGSFDSYNAVMTFYPDGTVGKTPYFKRHLVPFGEYLPMKDLIKTLIPPLAELNVFQDEITPGDDSEITSTQYGGIGSLICFDSIYENLTLDSVRDGAQLIAISTNDSWYHSSASVYQHNGHAVLRAVESGRYVVRAASTGISSVISPSGKILESLGPLTEGNVYGEVYFRSARTFYSYVGDIIVAASAVYAAAVAGAGFLQNAGRRKRLKDGQAV